MSDKQLNKEQFAGINLEDNKELDLTKFSGKQEELKELEQDYKNPVAINKPAGDLASPGKAYIDKGENKQKLNETIEMVKGFMPPAYEADIVQQLLTNERLISKDSPEMILVKKKITLVRNAMSSKDEKLYTEKDLNALITLYNEAVGACNAYITDDRKRKSSTRWKLVNENMIQLNEEAMRLETVRDMMSMGNWENKAMTLKQLVMEARKIPLSGKADLAKQRIAYESEFASLKRLQPSITKERYNDLRKSRKYSAIFSNATYTGIVKDAGNKNLRNLSGAASALLSTVRFDEKGHAIEADREIDDNNIAWLGSLATGDLETIRPMIARQARELSDYFAWIENKTGDPAVCVAKFAEDPVRGSSQPRA